MLIQCSLWHLSCLYCHFLISMKENAYAQLLKWKLSDCGFWIWQSKPKWLTTCIRAPLNRRPALMLLDQSCEIVLLINASCSDRSISESHHLPALRLTCLLELCIYLGKMQHIQAVTSWLSLGRDSQASRPTPLQLFLSLTPHIPVSSVLFINHYTTHSGQQSTVDLSKAGVTQ